MTDNVILSEYVASYVEELRFKHKDKNMSEECVKIDMLHLSMIIRINYVVK